MTKQPGLFPGAVQYPGAFEMFWRVYPRKVGKHAALKAWLRAVRQGADPGVIADAAARYPWPSDARYIPYPATWLNRGSWEDDPMHVAPPSPTMQAITRMLRDD